MGCSSEHTATSVVRLTSVKPLLQSLALGLLMAFECELKAASKL